MVDRTPSFSKSYSQLPASLAQPESWGEKNQLATSTTKMSLLVATYRNSVSTFPVLGVGLYLQYNFKYSNPGISQKGNWYIFQKQLNPAAPDITWSFFWSFHTSFPIHLSRFSPPLFLFIYLFFTFFCFTLPSSGSLQLHFLLIRILFSFQFLFPLFPSYHLFWLLPPLSCFAHVHTSPTINPPFHSIFPCYHPSMLHCVFMWMVLQIKMPRRKVRSSRRAVP